MKVVEKFTEIFAVQAGDTALKYLPYGGVYLVGGVTMGIRDYMIQNTQFMDDFYQKGRAESELLPHCQTSNTIQCLPATKAI